MLNGAGDGRRPASPSAPGPSGVALNEADARLYVLNRFDNTISIVDTDDQHPGRHASASPARRSFDPSPDVIKVGRKFLYDGAAHLRPRRHRLRHLPRLRQLRQPRLGPRRSAGRLRDLQQAPWVTFAPLGPSTTGFDPMKGPMTTQTLRGLKNIEPFHWRGDRQNFQAFNHAFVA